MNDKDQQSTESFVQNLIIKYKDDREDISIIGSKLKYVHTEPVYDDAHPQNGNPIDNKKTTKTANINQNNLKQLLSFIHSTDFFKFKDAYGADEGSRFHLTEIYVKDGNLEKTVQFRESPKFPEHPPADFDRVKTHILNIAKS
jgi:hypothetical protein